MFYEELLTGALVIVTVIIKLSTLVLLYGAYAHLDNHIVLTKQHIPIEKNNT